MHIFYISYRDVILKKSEFLWIFSSKGGGEKYKHRELALNFVQKQYFTLHFSRIETPWSSKKLILKFSFYEGAWDLKRFNLSSGFNLQHRKYELLFSFTTATAHRINCTLKINTVTNLCSLKWLTFNFKRVSFWILLQVLWFECLHIEFQPFFVATGRERIR